MNNYFNESYPVFETTLNSTEDETRKNKNEHTINSIKEFINFNPLKSCQNPLSPPVRSKKNYLNFKNISKQNKRGLSNYLFYSPINGAVEAKTFSDFGFLKPNEDICWLEKRADEGSFWLNCFNPSNEELCLIQKVFNIHPLTIEDLENRVERERERCEFFENYYCLIIHCTASNFSSKNYYNSVEKDQYSISKQELLIKASNEIVTLFILVFNDFV
ncbi:Mg(2+) transporter [Clydaea vesicula]|uniref:Mg(2+) transporter n=1 Tax=Clydaea vesicula TaxID=447962 RepID=A0AAD5UAX9_9FUNG|nr:Mg(2+) transporter [Clydaea vesicula]